MKLALKIFKVTGILVVILAITLFSASLILQDKVTGIILRSLNKNISTKFEFKAVSLSFLKRFPKASLDLRNVLVHSSPGFDVTGFGTADTDTLLWAGTVTAEFRLRDIIRGNYNIERIGIKGGFINLYTDTAGKVNYHIASEQKNNSDGDFTINLDRISLADTKASYNNLATHLFVSGIINNGRLKSRISGENIDFFAEAKLHIDHFRLFNFTINRSIPSDFNVGLHSSGSGVMFNKSTVILDHNNFVLSGFVSSGNDLDLTLTGEKIDLSVIKKYIPERYQEKILSYNPSGLLNIDCQFRGPLTHTENPRMDILFKLENGKIEYRHSSLAIGGLSFSGKFSNGNRMIPETSSVQVRDLNCKLGSAGYSGSLVLNNFDSLYGSLKLRGKLIPSEIKDFFNLKEFSDAEGDIDFNLEMTGFVPGKDNFTFAELVRLKPSADMIFNSFGINYREGKFNVRNVTGNLLFADTTIARNLSFSYKGQDFTTSGTFIKLPSWLAGRSGMLTVNANISCNNLAPEQLFPRQSDPASPDKRKQAFTFPRDMTFDINFSTDHFIYKTFSAEKIKGTVSYKPGIFNFKTLDLNSMDGSISGNGFVAQNANKSFVGRGSFSLDKIDVNKTFESFHNFGQSFIKAENLAGLLSGSLSVLIPMDSMFRPVIKSVTAEGKYSLENGSLKDFEPVKNLSSFIELSELENIKFNRLENDFFIRNNSLYMPSMDVHSSAAELTVNGKHDFDNNYEYHVKVLLSELLSKKLHKPRPNTSEFGAVKDDGLGRTSVLLRVENKGEDVKVSYDLKATGSQIRNDIKNERQNLRSILNQEYGWFKKDSVVNKKQNTGAPRFKISFDDIDSTKIENQEPWTKKESGIKNPFKKNN